MKIKGKQLHTVMAGLLGILAGAQNAKIIREATALRKEIESAIAARSELHDALNRLVDILEIVVDPKATVKTVRKIIVKLLEGKLSDAKAPIAVEALGIIDGLLAAEEEEIDLLRPHISLTDEQIEKLCSRQNANGPLCTGEHIALAEPILSFDA